MVFILSVGVLAPWHLSMLKRELRCIIRRKRFTWLGHVTRMNKDRGAKQVNYRLQEEKWEGKTEGKLAGDHPRRPARIRTGVGRCSRCGGRQG